MSVSFEEALETLTGMFGDWDRDTLALVLESQNYRLESAIEFILESGGPSGSQQLSQQPAQSADLLDLGVGAPAPAPAPGSRPSGNQERSAAPANGPRGTHFELPDDFLRVPGQRGDDPNRIITDEELAMMMQNELYLRAISEVQRDRQANPEGGRREHPLAAEIPDMGILKGLNSVGSAMKSGFGNLTSKLSAMQSGSGNNRDRYDEDGDNMEMNPLVQGIGQDDDDDEEAVEFLTSPHARRAAGGSSGSSSAPVGNKKDR